MSSSTATVTTTKRKLRPARKQVAVDQIDKTEQVQTGKEYNIWFNKWAGGDREDSYGNKTHSQSRCVIIRDSGYTRADANGTRYCCLFFARGCCPLGHECKYLHRLPLPTHQIPDTSMDCFAREKHADYRDDMGGVGSFGRQNRTLYVGRLQEAGSKEDTEEMVTRHFSEWGEIVRINILYNRGVAFVTYSNEAQAQFAKEAMSNQSLDGEEILNVRWATEDPNPIQKVSEKRRIEELGQEAIQGKIDENMIEAVQAVGALEEGREEDYYPIVAPVDDDAPEEGRAGKRLRLEAPPKEGENEKKSSLFGGEALDNLKYWAEMARKQAEEVKTLSGTASGKAQNKSVGLGGIGGYGSDSDEE